MYFQPNRDGVVDRVDRGSWVVGRGSWVVGRGVRFALSSSWFKKIEDFETSRFGVDLFSSFGFYVRIE